MHFAVIDLEGTTLDTFQSDPAAARALREMVRSDPALAEDLSVVEYREGIRVGPPRSISEFLKRSGQGSLRLPSDQSIPSPEIEIEQGEAGSSKAIVVQHQDVVERVQSSSGVALFMRKHRWSDHGLAAGHC